MELLFKRKIGNFDENTSMKKLTSVLVLFFIMISCSKSFAQDNIITASDFAPLLGSGWKGSLTYIDYTSNKPTTIPVNLSVSQINDTSFELSLTFPDEPQANGADTMHILNDGTYLDNKKIVSVQKSGDVTTITGESTGSDNDKPAQFKYTYVISSSEFSITKEVKYDDSSEYFVRNKYQFNK